MTAIAQLVEGHGEKLDQLEAEMHRLPQQSCSVRHIFAPGMYIREVSIPGGTYVVTHKHREPHLNVFVKGSGVMIMCNGTQQPMQAPMTFTSQPGRKVGYVETDLVWLNIWATDETDIDKLEAMYFDKTEEFAEAQQQHRLTQNVVLIGHDRDDYATVLDELNVPESYARSVSQNTDDLIPLPFGAYKVKIGASLIEGKGVIATADIAKGEIIGPARIGNKRTPIGRYANHSPVANSKFVNAGDRIILVALRPIAGCRGGFDGEEVTVNYRDAIALNLQIGAQS